MKTLLVLLLIFLSTSLNALPVKTDHLYSKKDYNKVVTDVSFTATARFGNNRYYGSYELGTGSFFPYRWQQFQWSKGSAEHFSLEYNSSANLLTYTVGSARINYNVYGTFTDMFIKTSATKKGSWISIDNLLLNGESIDDFSYANYYGDKNDYLHISSLLFSDDFILEGYSRMFWLDNKLPIYSKLFYELTLVSVIDSYGWTDSDDSKYTEPVPEPLTIILLLASFIPCFKKFSGSNQKPE